jgi:hypothetical protein
MPFASSPTEPNRKSFNSEWSSENRAGNVISYPAPLSWDCSDLGFAESSCGHPKYERPITTTAAATAVPQILGRKLAETRIGLPRYREKGFLPSLPPQNCASGENSSVSRRETEGFVG